MIELKEFKRIFDTYFDNIRSYIFYRIGNEDDASDMTQDVFMKIWIKRNNLDSRNIKALLYKISSDLIITKYRKNNVKTKFIEHTTYTNKNKYDITPENLINYKTLKNRYIEALSQLTENQRSVFLMHREEDLSYKEIAERVGISNKAVEKRISKSLKHLKTVLKDLIEF